MREDEIEALLKLDGAKLKVYSPFSIHTAIIHLPVSNGPHKIRSLSRKAELRSDAVQDVWKVYQNYMRGSKHEQYQLESINWLFEEAQANVEIQLHTGEANGNKDQS